MNYFKRVIGSLMNKFFIIKKLTLYIQCAIIGFVVVINIVVHAHKLRKHDRIFIAYRGFAHTVIDTLAFLELHPKKGIVIIVGLIGDHYPSFTQRNKMFPLLLGNEKIISMTSRPYFLVNGAEGLWIWANIYEKTLKLFYLILRNKHAIISYNSRDTTKTPACNFISSSLKISNDKAYKIFEDLEKQLISSGNGHIAGHQLLFMKEWNLDFYSGVKNADDIKFINNILANFSVKPSICFVIRNKLDLYSDISLSYYVEAIQFLCSRNFSVSLCGDTANLLNLIKNKHKDLQASITNFCINSHKQKQIFELIVAAKCKFAVGDSGGFWSVLKIYNKPGLLINGQINNLIYNVEALPKRWINSCNSVEVLNADLLFGTLFYKEFRYDLHNSHNSVFLQEVNEKDFILNALVRYVDIENFAYPKKMEPKILEKIPGNIWIKLAKDCSYSNDFLTKLEF